MRRKHWRKILSGSSVTEAGGRRAEGERTYNDPMNVCLRVLAILAVCVWQSSVSAQPTIEFDIPQQRADRALIAFAEQADITLLFSFDDTANRSANELRGSYEVSAGLKALVAGTGLTMSMSKQGQLRVAVHMPLAEERQMKMDSIWRRIGVTLAAAVLGGGSAANADDTPTTQKVIEEVVVTATKRGTTLQDTPIAISALTEEEMARQGIENFEDFARQIPGVILSGGKNFQKFTIRGIQTSASISSMGEQKPVAVYYDEVPVSTFSILTPDLRLYDMERVEVLRGPQGTAFGSGSMAGGVRIITNKADLTGFDASARIDVGSSEMGGLRQRYSGMINVPLSETVAVRAVGYTRNEDGYIDNVGTFGLGRVDDENDSDEWGLRGSLIWEPTDRFRVTLSAMHDDIDANSLGSFQQPSLGDYKRATFLTDNVTVETDNVNVTLEYDFEWASLVSSTTYATAETSWDLDLDAIFGAFMPFGYSEGLEQAAWVQEVRLVSNTAGSIEWLAGLFHLNRETDFFGSTFTTPGFLDSQGIDYSALPHVQSPGVDTDPTIKVLENTESAVFGELTYHLTDTLSVTGGLRYTEVEYEDTLTGKGNTTNVLDLVFAGVGGVASATADVPLATTVKESATTAKLILNWQPSDDRTFYLSAAEGFRRPHPNATALQPNTVDPNDPTIIPLVADSDTLWSYELGAKTRWLDGRVQANVALYFIDWEDIQLSATRGSDGAPYATNAGDVESKGVEVELLFWPSERLELGLNITVAKSEIVSLSQGDAITSGEVKGAELAAPESQYAGFAQYSWPIGRHTMFARVDVQHIDEYPNAPPNVPGSANQTPNPNFAVVDAYENVNAQIGWESEQVSVVLYVENALNHDDPIYINPDVFSFNRYGTLRPRTVGLRADWRL